LYFNENTFIISALLLAFYFSFIPYKTIINIKNIDEYFDFYNLFIKFKGNIEFIKLVEEKATTKHINFINEYKDYFLYGKKKKKRNSVYSKNNISIDDYAASRGMSVSWFIRNFKKYTGSTPMQFIVGI